MTLPTESVLDNEFKRDVMRGLQSEQKSIPSKYLYDENGSKLFDQICELEEYYPTRTELSIMQTHSSDIADQIGSRVMLVEYGSGSSQKTRLLLDALHEPTAYVPVDISEDHLLRTAATLQQDYPEIEVLPVSGDFTRPFELPVSEEPYSHVAVYFPGSTIGNFTNHQSGSILERMSSQLGTQGGLLIGIDLQKDVSVLEAAYNDDQQVTAAFNLNLLERINRELEGTFDLDDFEHEAIYDREQHRIVISIVSTRKQQVWIGETPIEFHAGEKILTEYSHKYSVADFAAFARQFGFNLHEYWTDERDYFGVLHLVLDDETDSR